MHADTINILSLPGISVDMDTSDGIRLAASGPLSAACAPALKRINERLKAEKPALVREDSVIASTWLPPIPGKVFNRLVKAEVSCALGRYVPETVSIETTRECKCNCEHCTVSEGTGEMSNGQIKHIIDQALDMGAVVITFTEGDPLLRPDIFELIEYVDRDRAVVNLFTPGTEMTPQAAARLKQAGLHNLLVSIYSTDPAAHDRTRRLEGAYEKAVSAIKMGLDAGLLVTMTTHITPARMHELPGLYELAGRLGVHEFSIWENTARQLHDPVISRSDRAVILDMYHSINKNKEGPRVFANSYFEGEMLGCMAGRRWAHICVDGSVRACPYMPFLFGNALEAGGLARAWKIIRSLKDFKGRRDLCMMQDPLFLANLDKIPQNSESRYDHKHVFL